MTAGRSKPKDDSRYCGGKKHHGRRHVHTARLAGALIIQVRDDCKLHGGSVPSGRKAAATELAQRAVDTYGLPRDISPTDALLEEVRFTAGHVAWLRQRVSELAPGCADVGHAGGCRQAGDRVHGHGHDRGRAVNVWLELYYRERKHLVDVCKAAISVGIEERYVRLAEAQGAIVAEVIRRILSRLGLSDEQSALVPFVVPEELRRAAAGALN